MKDQIKEEWFDGIRAYRAFLYGVDLIDKLNSAKELGYLVYDDEDGSVMNGDFVVELNENDSVLGYRPNNSNCLFTYAGCTHSIEDHKIYCTKKGIKENFSNISIIEKPKTVKLL